MTLGAPEPAKGPSRSPWCGARVLVAGGTGSLGRALVERLLALEPERVCVLSRDEHKQAAMADALGRDVPVRFCLGDVRDRDRVERALAGIDVVVMAAALKVVPSCERHADEAVRTNVDGLRNVLMAMRRLPVQRLVVLGTDKAVEPINAMGLTKALQERLVAAAQPDAGAVLTVVRYGNVFGSRSSVVEQLCARARRGLPLRITDPAMTRFFLTLGQACELVLDRTMRAVGGEVFVPRLKKIDLGRLAAIVGERIAGAGPVEIVGRRPGDKVHETLVSRHEAYRTRIERDGFVILPAEPMPVRHRGYDALPVLGEPYESQDADDLTTHEVVAMLEEGGFVA